MYLGEQSKRDIVMGKSTFLNFSLLSLLMKVVKLCLQQAEN